MNSSRIACREHPSRRRPARAHSQADPSSPLFDSSRWIEAKHPLPLSHRHVNEYLVEHTDRTTDPRCRSLNCLRIPEIYPKHRCVVNECSEPRQVIDSTKRRKRQNPQFRRKRYTAGTRGREPVVLLVHRNAQATSLAGPTGTREATIGNGLGNAAPQAVRGEA
jgi:hypothetical protein